MKDISNQRFGRLVAIEPLRSEKGKGVIWRCACDCGGEIEVSTSRLTAGKNKSCGCLKREISERADITGQRFGRLVAVRFDHVDEKRRSCYLFKCDCGNEKVLPASSVKWGRVQSCGCLNLEQVTNLRKQDITGERFDRLTAVRPTDERDASGSVVWECLCVCGNTSFQTVNTLRSGRIHSCGCLYRETRAEAISFRKDFVDGTSLSSIASSKKARPGTPSGHAGVSLEKRTGRWDAYINFRKKRYRLGSYRNLSDAIEAREEAERRLHDPVIEEMWENMTPTSQGKFLEYLKSGQDD